MNRLFAACLVVGIGAVGERGSRDSRPVRPSAAIEEMLWWLPADTETLMVQQASAPRMRGLVHDALLSDRNRRGRLGAHGIREASLTGSAPQTHTRRVAALYRHRAGLGEFPYEGVTIYAFMKPLGARWPGAHERPGEDRHACPPSARLRCCRVQREQSKTPLGRTTWRSRGPTFSSTRRTSTISQRCLRGLQSGLKRAPFPASYPSGAGWMRGRRSGHCATTDGNTSTKDPTSPFRKDEAGKSLDPDAVGMTAHASPDGRTIVTHYLSKNATADRVATRMFSHPGDGVTPVVRRAGDDATELRFVAKDEDHLSMFVFYLFMALGRGTAL